MNSKIKIKNSKLALAASALCIALASNAQAQPRKVGFLGVTDLSTNTARVEGFRQGLRDLGYVEGKNISVEYRWGEGKMERLTALAGELVRDKVEVIVTAGPAATRPAKEATKTVPIVMAQDDDPIGNGFVAALAHPGGNITGLSAVFPELSGKRLEVMKEILPTVSRVAVFGTSPTGAGQTLKETEAAARTFGVQSLYLDVQDAKTLPSAFEAARKWRADCALVLSSAVIFSQRPAIARLAIKNRLPVVFPQSEYVEDGGLMSYAPNYPDMFRRAAYYVDKILKGAKPADLPVEQPTKFELVINLKTAKQIGLTIPPNVLARADRVIK
jgi:ABC-type uncharacterized transport system substrate-binding protein